MNECRWLTDKYICLMLLVFPLWTGFSGYSALTVSKYVFFTAATGLWLLGLLFCMLRRRLRPARPDAAGWCALAFMAAACLSAALSPYGASTVIGAARRDGLLTLLLYGGIFLGVSRFGQAKKYYVYLLALSATICCAVAVLQLYGRNALWLFPQGLGYYDADVKYSGAFLGTIGNTGVLAAFISLCVPVFALTALLSHRRRDLLLLLPALLCVYVLIRSGVASGAVALIAAALMGAPYYVNQRFHKKRLTLWASGASAALCLAGMLAAYAYSGPEGGTLWELSRVLHGEIDDSFGSSRVLIWRQALELFSERPLFGGGPDSFGARCALDFSRVIPERGGLVTVHVDNAHCEPLGYLVNLGLAGLAPYLALCAAALQKWLRGAAPAFGLGALCYLAQSLFGLGLSIIVPIFWIFLGLICAPAEEKSDC